MRPRCGALGLALSLALGGAVARPGPAATSEPARLKVATNPYLSFAPFYIAQAEGLFARQGLEVELVDLRRSALWLTPVIRGDLDVGAGPVTPGLFNAIARGAGIRVVAGKEYFDPEAACAYQGIALGPELAARGRADDPALLAGRIVSLRRDTIYGYFLGRVLARAGLTLDDVVLRSYPAATEIEALLTGQIDALCAGEPWLRRALDADGVVLAHSAREVLPGFQPGVLVFGPTLLEGERDLGRRFLSGYLAGVERYREGKTERNLELMEAFLGLDRDLLARACWPSFEPSGRLDLAGLLDFQRWLAGERLVDEVLPASAFWEPAFLESLAAGPLGGSP